MNEKIRALATQARLSWCMQNDFDQQNLQEFAELIIQECVATCDARAENPAQGSFRDGALLCGQDIKRHFGIEG